MRLLTVQSWISENRREDKESVVWKADHGETDDALSAFRNISCGPKNIMDGAN